jgi:nucleoside phosphorylase
LPVLVVFPLKAEFKKFFEAHSLLTGAQTDLNQVSGFKSLVYKHPRKNIYFAIGGLGKAQVAVSISEILSKLKISKILVLGCCGALTKQHAVGDIVSAVKIIDCDWNSKYLNQNGREFLLKPIENLNYEGRTHKSSILSVEQEIASGDQSQSLISRFGHGVVAMESAGGIVAAKHFSTPYFEIRAVSDHCDSESLGNFNQGLTEAMSNLAKLFCCMTEFLES